MRCRTAIFLAGSLMSASAPPALAQQSLLGNTGTAQQDLGPPVPVPPAPPIAPEAPAAPAPQMVAPPPPPGLVQTPAPPPNADAGAPTNADAGAPTNADAGDAAATPPNAPPAAQAAPVPSTADSMPPAPPNDWVPQKSAELGILDKVDGSTTALTIPVGGQATAGDLLINVLACTSRPADDVPDDAVFVSIQPVVQSDGGPIFRGWMLRSLPGATVVGDASETFRLSGCG